jgi:hypothetical protein
MIDISRRQALAAMGWAGIGFGASGCSIPITPFCPTDPTISNPSLPLTIDAHTHVFNGTDLQIEGFFDLIVAVDNPSLKGLGQILQELGRDFAPTAAEEMAELPTMDAVLRSCDTRTSLQTFESYRQKGYSRAVYGLKGALRRVKRFRSSSHITPEIERQINALPENYSDYKISLSRLRKARLSPDSIKVAGGIDFIIRNFQFRYANVYDYLLEYSQGRARKIDLLVAHLVDFDWPIGNGSSTPTSLTDQVRVMERISQLTGGRALCFAPFDPMKEVAYGLGLTPESSFHLVQDAVSNHGFIGVKLYPPMGFAPINNVSLGAKFWNQSWIPASLHRDDMGARLDHAMSELYSWCLANGVPIMAHTSPSNGPSPAFKQLTQTKYWRRVRDTFKGIRIDFGHFGDTDLIDNKGLRAKHLSILMDLMGGQFLYADSGYFVDLLSREADLQNYLTSLLRFSANKGDAALAQRLMYGTDWEMVVLEGQASDQYLQRFEAIFDVLDHDASLGAKGRLSDRFFGVNAAMFLGLAAGQPNRQRLDRYYGLGPKPAWMAKVDRIAALTV